MGTSFLAHEGRFYIGNNEIARSEFERSITTLNGFGDCLELIQSDDVIGGHLGKLVGTVVSAGGIGSSEEVLLRLLLNFSRKIDGEESFDTIYTGFEEFFYGQELKFQDTVRLYNFHTEVEIDLGNGLTIKKLIEEKAESAPVGSLRWLEIQAQSQFVISRVYTREKIIWNDDPMKSATQQLEKAGAQMEESPKIFDAVVTALRLYKSSAIYRGSAITTEDLTFSPIGGISTRTSFDHNPILGARCELSEKDIGPFKNLFHTFKEDSTQFKIASNRLSFAMQRRTLEDKLIDLMIGLESLYLPDRDQELTFRLCMRAALILEVGENRRMLFDFLNSMAKLRGSIIHGNNKKLTYKDVSKLEGILRRSLILWAGDRTIFQENNLQLLPFT